VLNIIVPRTKQIVAPTVNSLQSILDLSLDIESGSTVTSQSRGSLGNQDRSKRNPLPRLKPQLPVTLHILTTKQSLMKKRRMS